jgi:hypothetical protein
VWILNPGTEGNLPDNAEMDGPLTHLAFYAGWPAAMTAALVAKQVFEGR